MDWTCVSNKHVRFHFQYDHWEECKSKLNNEPYKHGGINGKWWAK